MEASGAARTTHHELVAAATRAFELLRSDPAALSEVSRAATAGSARPGAGSRQLPHQEIRRHVVVLVEALLALLAGGHDRAGAVAAADGLAADRAAQGVSLASLLAGFQAARAMVLESLLEQVRDVVSPEQLAPMLQLLDTAVGDLQRGMVLAHQAAEKSLSRLSSATRVEALRALLTEGDPSALRDLGLLAERRHRCVVAAVSEPQQARTVASQLATADSVSGLVLGYLCQVSTRPPHDTGQFDRVLVVASPPVAVDELPAAHALCRRAVELGEARGDVGLRPLADYALDVALGDHTLLGRLVVGTLLVDLDPADAFHRQLAETGFTHLGNGRRIGATAAALHLHPNTVTHRLRRLADLTGFPAVAEEPETFVATARWWWALRTWRADAGR